jgi:hypothetical protein
MIALYSIIRRWIHSGAIVLKIQFFRTLCIFKTRSTFISLLKI